MDALYGVFAIILSVMIIASASLAIQAFNACPNYKQEHMTAFNFTAGMVASGCVCVVIAIALLAFGDRANIRRNYQQVRN